MFGTTVFVIIMPNVFELCLFKYYGILLQKMCHYYSFSGFQGLQKVSLYSFLNEVFHEL